MVFLVFYGRLFCRLAVLGSKDYSQVLGHSHYYAIYMFSTFFRVLSLGGYYSRS